VHFTGSQFSYSGRLEFILLVKKPNFGTLWSFKIAQNVLQFIPFKNVGDVASNGERFTLANAASLKTYIPSKINKKKS
jgi:hypothetical protein